MEFEYNLENPLLHSEDDASLFFIENDHMPSKAYLQGLDAMDDTNFSIRREIVSLIFSFSRSFDSFLAYLAVNYLDRFLSSHSIVPDGKPWILKLVAISCVTLALKMRKTEFSISDLQNEDDSCVLDLLTIERMEMVILGALKWRMRSVNPFSFVHYFIKFFSFEDEEASVQALKDRTTEIILKAQNDVKLLEYKPSVVSASALLSAAHELFPVQLASFKDGITSCSYVNKENLWRCYDLMQDLISMDVNGSMAAEIMGSCSCTTTSPAKCIQ